MGCCSVTQRHTGMDEVGPDEIELLEIDGTGVWSLGETKLRTGSEELPLRCPSVRQLKERNPDPVSPTVSAHSHNSQVALWGKTMEDLHHRIYTLPIRSWEGQAVHTYGEIFWSSLVLLHNSRTQERSERYLVLFSFHLLILSLDHSAQDFIYEGVLPLSGMSVRAIFQDCNTSDMLEISGPLVESKTFICTSTLDMKRWLDMIEDRRNKSKRLQLSPSYSALSCLVPCDESWKKEELKRYLLWAPIWQWEGSPIQHMGSISYLSLVYIINKQRQESQERLLVLFPEDLLLLSVDSHRACVQYEGRLARKSIKAIERSALPGRLELELAGDLMEPLLVSCTCPEDYQNWIFQLQQPEENTNTISNQPAPPLIPKKRRS